MTLLVDIYKHVSLKGLMPKPSCRFSECIHFSGEKKKLSSINGIKLLPCV